MGRTKPGICARARGPVDEDCDDEHTDDGTRARGTIDYYADADGNGDGEEGSRAPIQQMAHVVPVKSKRCHRRILTVSCVESVCPSVMNPV